MRPRRAALGSLLFFVLAPGIVDGVVPWWLTRWRAGSGANPVGRIAGALLLAAGLGVLVEAFVRFARVGRGTPSPTHPTERLVVSGLYRYTRNPMYLAVLAIVLGQAWILWRSELVVYGAGAALAVELWVRLYEEPTLARRYGEEYRRYRAAVPRWAVRFRPWRG